MARYVLNESACCSSPSNFEIYESLASLCGQLEGWYVREESYRVFDSEGRRVFLHADADHLPVTATIEEEPTHRDELMRLLRAVIEDKHYYGKFFERDGEEWKSGQLVDLITLVESRLGTFEGNEARWREMRRRKWDQRLLPVRRFLAMLKLWK
ncbi:hypothetical protein [Pyruvatibacter mobilis]|uniref:hypothetical protein n=1 Tax=Pyruvatibacter mobilis TaxID=1712261 RepID=UPI003BA96262